MAIYYLEAKLISRSKGRTAIAAAAYRACERLADKRTGLTHDYSRKQGLVQATILLPQNAPKSYHERELLWNAVEQAERRKDAQLAREIIIALPRELSETQNWQLAKAFVQHEFVNKGMIADLTFHRGHRHEEGQPHVHVLLTTREITSQGFGRKIRAWNNRELLQNWRANWATHCNQAFIRLGLTCRIDHRSLVEQGIDLEPQNKIGPKIARDHSEKLVDHRRIARDNGERIYANPLIALTALVKANSAYTDADLQAFVFRHSDGNAQFERVLAKVRQYAKTHHVTLDQSPTIIDHLLFDDAVSQTDQPSMTDEQIVTNVISHCETLESTFNLPALQTNVMAHTQNQAQHQRVMAFIQAHTAMIALGLGEDGREHFTTRTAFKKEMQLMADVNTLAKRNTFSTNKMKMRTSAKKFTLNSSQKAALAHITAAQNVGLIEGFAGTGKTHLLKAAYDVWHHSGYQVYGVALSGIASLGLEDGSDQSNTIESFTWCLRESKIRLTPKSIVVMDEMSMTGLDDMAKIVAAVRNAGAKFVGVGDIEQTQSIKRGASARAIIEQIGAVKLDQIVRQKVEWQRQATLEMETAQTRCALERYEQHGRIHLTKDMASCQAQVLDHWLHCLNQQGASPQSALMIAHQNETVNWLNIHARQLLLDAGRLKGDTYFFNADQRQLSVCIGERLLFLENDKTLGVRNGHFGTLDAVEGDKFKIRLDSGKQITIGQDYRHINYGYAATVHRLQSYTCNYGIVCFDGHGWDRHLTLVGCSRHQLDLMLIASQAHFADMTDFKDQLSRIGLKDHVLDFPASFAIRRGFERNDIVDRTIAIIRDSLTRVRDRWGYIFNLQDTLEEKISTDNMQQQRRQDAVLVADFCDLKLSIAEKMNLIKLDELAFTLGNLAAIQTRGDFTGIDYQLRDVSNMTATYQAIYADRLSAGQMAERIMNDLPRYQTALDRNRMTRPRLEAARQFWQDAQWIKELFERMGRKEVIKNKTSNNDTATLRFEVLTPKIAHTIISDVTSYWGHIVGQFNYESNPTMAAHAFVMKLRELELPLRLSASLEQGLIQPGKTHTMLGAYWQAEIALAALNTTIKRRQKTQVSPSQSKNNTEKMNKNMADLYQQRAEYYAQRDACAAYLVSQKLNQAVIDHFALKPERLKKQAQAHRDRSVVCHFNDLPRSTPLVENIGRQHLARTILRQPQKYQRYLYHHVTGGHYTLLHEYKCYQRSIKRLQASPQMRTFMRLTDTYISASRDTAKAWARVSRSQENRSPKTAHRVQQARRYTHKRNALAAKLTANFMYNANSFQLSGIHIDKLCDQARSHTHLQANNTQRGVLTSQLLKNQSDDHSIYAKSSDWKPCHAKAQQADDAPPLVASKKIQPIKQRHSEQLQQTSKDITTQQGYPTPPQRDTTQDYNPLGLSLDLRNRLVDFAYASQQYPFSSTHFEHAHRVTDFDKAHELQPFREQLKEKTDHRAYGFTNKIKNSVINGNFNAQHLLALVRSVDRCITHAQWQKQNQSTELKNEQSHDDLDFSL